jgi:hypothetical protein
MKILKTVGLFGILLAGTSFVPSQAGAQDSTAIEQKLTAKYALTKTTADRTDIVKAGSVLVLKKDNLMMVDVSNSNLFQNTYKDGKISQNALGKISRFHLPGVPAPPGGGGAQRTFVAGEKMWVTGISIKDNGVNVELYTDAINDVRYRAVLNFPVKGSALTADQADKAVAEVFDVQPSDDAGGNAQSQEAGQQAGQPGGQQAGPPAKGQQAAVAQPATAPAAQADAPPPPIAPPPPPADEPAPAPKTVALGQTKDVVVGNFGQPDKIATVGTKEIYYYKDFKVTFIKGKVTDVQ